MPVADGERLPDRTGYILLRAPRCRRQAAAMCKEGGQRRGERAPGAVSVLRRDPRGPEFEELVAIEEQVDHLFAGGVAALDDHRPGAESMDSSRRFPGVCR